MSEESVSLAMSQPDITERDIELVTQVLRSGQLSIGPFIEQFEELVRSYVGTRHAVAVSSGTAGLHLCMRLANVGDGSERHHVTLQLHRLGKLHPLRARNAALRRHRRDKLQPRH